MSSNIRPYWRGEAFLPPSFSTFTSMVAQAVEKNKDHKDSRIMTRIANGREKAMGWIRGDRLGFNVKTCLIYDNNRPECPTVEPIPNFSFFTPHFTCMPVPCFVGSSKQFMSRSWRDRQASPAAIGAASLPWVEGFGASPVLRHDLRMEHGELTNSSRMQPCLSTAIGGTFLTICATQGMAVYRISEASPEL
jgi:hypothetical protein